MYAETGTAMRTALAALLRQHRVQHRLGRTTEQRAETGTLLRQFRHTVLAWCDQTLESVRPLTFSNQPSGRPNPFRTAGAGRDITPAGELGRSVHLALTADTASPASLEQLTTPAGHPHVELWRQAARAAALAEHDTAPDVAATMTAPQAQAVVADIAAIVQALVVLDRRHGNTPGWEHLTHGDRLGWTALAAALDVNLGQPDYTVDRLGWRPRVKTIAGPAKPGILGVLQAQHNLVVKMGSLPTTINLRYVIDSQRLLSRQLVPFAERIDHRLSEHWSSRADTYGELQRHFRSISGLLGTGGGAAAAEGANAVARLRAIPDDTIIEPRVLGGLQLLFDRLDQRIVDLVDDGIAQGAFAQRVRLPRPVETDDAAATARDQLRPVAPAYNHDLADAARRLVPNSHHETASPGTARANLHSALVHRAATRDLGTAPQL